MADNYNKKESDDRIAKNVKEGISSYFPEPGTDWGAKLKAAMGIKDPLQEAIERRKKNYAGSNTK